MEERTERSEAQARAQLESIREMIAALECDYERLEELPEYIEDAINRFKEAQEDGEEDTSELEKEIDELQEELSELESQAGDCKNPEQAEQRIREDPLSVEVRSGWCSYGPEMTPEEFRILLCTGGPAVQIIGELGQYNEPSSARIQHQDWFQPWTDLYLTGEEEDDVLTYCRQFYFE